MRDEGLLGREAAGGDRAALGELLRAHQHAAYGLALGLLGVEADAEDACQEAFLRAMRAIAGYDSSVGFRAWLLALVRSAAMDLRRARRRRREREGKYAMDAARSETAAPGARETSAAVRGALMALEERYRLPVMLHYVQGLTHAETARVLGQPEGTVATNVARGVERLRQALSRGGLGAVAVAGALGQLDLPAAPAALNAAIGQIAQGVAPASPLGGAGAASIKGGLAMKVVLGVVLAGALAGGAALFFEPATDNRQPATTLASPPAKGGLKIEHLVGCYAGECTLDGPRLEAIYGRIGGTLDTAGNAWMDRGRCVRKSDGMVITVYGGSGYNDPTLAEGPAAAFSNFTPASGYGQAAESSAMQGNPMEGGEKNCLYMSNGSRVCKIWRNKDKGDRWWFKKIIGGGKTPAPQAKGGSVPALEASLGIDMISVMPGDRLVVFGGGSFYEYKDDKLICLLGFSDYSKDAVKNNKGGPLRPTLGVLGGDGTFYVGYYFAGPAQVDRILPDGKLEPYVRGVSNNATDGPAMQMGMFCGPHIWMSMNDYRHIPADCLFLHSHDDGWLRRVRNGRVSTLCPDGEWRELASVGKDGIRWFRGYAPGPDGTAIVCCDPISKMGRFLVTGLDYGKAVVGPPVGGGSPSAPAEKKGE